MTEANHNPLGLAREDRVTFRRTPDGPLFKGRVMTVQGRSVRIVYRSARSPTDDGWFFLSDIVSKDD